MWTDLLLMLSVEETQAQTMICTCNLSQQVQSNNFMKEKNLNLEISGCPGQPILPWYLIIAGALTIILLVGRILICRVSVLNIKGGNLKMSQFVSGRCYCFPGDFDKFYHNPYQAPAS